MKNNYLLILFLIVSCRQIPNFPTTPIIHFKDINKKVFSSDKVDSVTIHLEYQDGDGDLGISPQQNDPPYSDFVCQNNVNAATETCPNSQIENKFKYNYFIKIFKKTTKKDTIEVVFSDEVTFDARFPILNTFPGENPIEGTISYTLGINYDALGSPLTRGDELFFQIQIADRALNLSNIINTNSIILGNE